MEVVFKTNKSHDDLPRFENDISIHRADTPEHYSSWKFSPRIICLQNSWKFLQQSFVTMKVFQLAFTCSKSTIETLDQGVKYVQS